MNDSNGLTPPKAMDDQQTGNQIIIVEEDSLVVGESENIEQIRVSHCNSKLLETSWTNEALRNDSMPQVNSVELVTSDDEILKQLEAAEKFAKNEAEITSAIRSLKTNLILCLILILIFVLLPALNPTFGILIVSLVKGFVPILTTISNFGKIQHLIWSYCKNLINM